MRSYTSTKNKFQPRVFKVFVLAALLGACARVTVPMGSNDVSAPTLITGSIATSTDIAYTDINEEDRAVIAANLDAAGPAIAPGAQISGLELPWQNAHSGNSGTLSKIDTSVLAETGCLSFKTTANTIAGIKLYTGTACRDIAQKFSVTALSVAEA